jgi:cation-transporting P-type ATPase E
MSVLASIELDEAFLRRGLTSAEVEERRAQGLVNAVPVQVSRTYGRILYDNAINPIHVSLFVISGVLLALGLVGDAVLTAGLVVGNIVVGVVQESRAKRQLDRIALLTRPMATVVRDGAESVIDPNDIVLGDFIRIRAGDQVQVDGPVLEANGLSLDESLLTGEADLVRKQAGDALHSGTFCLTGEGSQFAETIGAETVSYKITARARTFKTVRTPLQQEVALVIWSMAVVVAVLSLLVLNSFVNVYEGLPLVETTRAAAVTVALVPQGLWFMVTVAYSLAIVRTARSGILIQRLNAVESISRVDVLCLDKTGTLTSNALSLEAILPLGMPEAQLRTALGDFSASASFRNRTSETILAACPGELKAVTQEVVFDSARKWSGLAFEGAQYVLGAPEVLAPHVRNAASHEAQVEDAAEKGLRVLLFAGTRDALDIENATLPQAALTAYGLVILRDELRDDAAETVERFRAGGVSLKILSGDNPDTVAALARQAGFSSEATAIAGSELEGLDDAAMSELVNEATIFGRVTPDHKEQLIRALQRRGRFVAMIGDGVNDIPALKAAQVAAAMRSGSPATRSVADIVLLEDSFGALSKALLEGQRIRLGMASIFKLFLVRTLAITLVILIAALASDPFPLTPRQSAIYAALTVGIPAIALAAWARPGHTPNLLLPGAVAFVVPAAASIGLVGFVTYQIFLELDATLNEARTAFTLVGVLCGIALIPYAVQSQNEWLRREPLEERPRLVWLAAAMLVLFVVSYAVPILADFYEIEVLPVYAYAGIVAAVIAWAFLLKAVVRYGLDEWLGRQAESLLSRRVARMTRA